MTDLRTPDDTSRDDAADSARPLKDDPEAPSAAPTATDDDRDQGGDEGASETAPSDVEGAPPEVAAGGDDATASDGAPGDDEERSGALPRGNPLRVKRGLATLSVGAFAGFLVMAHSGTLRVGVPLGLLCALVAAFGAMDLAGTFDDRGEGRLAAAVSSRELAGPVARMVGACALFAGSLAGAQAAWGPSWLWPVAVTATFLAAVASIFFAGQALGPWRVDENGEERPLLRREGFWVVAIGALLYFPTLGLFSLWDPWETHYGEVAREIVARDDWISLWWAQDGWFWSKPILNFWIQALAMAGLGTHVTSDQMLLTAAGAVARPEWVVRTPNVLFTLAAMYLLYKGVARVFGRRAGLLGGLVLATMPDWYFLAHQTMTDMPFVASMTAAMGLLLYGINVDEHEEARLYEVSAFGRTFRFSLWHLVFGAVLVCALPQILYLISRNVELVLHGDGGKGFRFRWDEFQAGSAGNCGLPGNKPCTMHHSASVPKSVSANPEGLKLSLLRYFGAFEPSLQGLLWAAGLATLLYLNWGERRTRRLVYVAAWLCTAIATMAKGPAGFILPMLCAFAYVAATRRWEELLKLEMLSGLLVILCVALPWYVAMYVRHGPPFTDRLIIHDMYNRALSHVHDTNEGDDTGIRYYVWQLGYATFPWTGLAPLGLLWWARKGDDATTGDGRRIGDASIMLVMWFLFAFALFTFMGTKFHHYIFPAVPPVAMLVGVVLDSMLGEGRVVKKGSALPYAIVMAAGTALLAFGASRFAPGSWFGQLSDNGELAPPNVTLGALSMLAGVGAVAVAVVLFRARDEREEADEQARSSSDDAVGRTHERTMVGAAALAGALLTVLVTRDLATKPEGASQPGAIRLLQLFTYNYKRPWPESLDFSAALAGFGAAATLLVLFFVVLRLRKHAVLAMCAFACVWAVWGLDVYMMKTSPHWGQHELIEAYYRDRKSPDEVLVAYQMNWKGENFYTSNRVPAFVSTGAKFQEWLKEQREKGQTTLYLITEHTRTGGLRSEVSPKSYTELTDKALCNKFVLVKVEL